MKRSPIIRKKKKPKSKNRIDTSGFAFPRPADRPKHEPDWITVLPDGREILNNKTSDKGIAEYRRRTLAMVARQAGRCAYPECGALMTEPTFDHMGPFDRNGKQSGGGRGLGGSRRDDRIEVEIDGKRVPINRAVCWRCNSELGSRRY